jgi:hypothetical protein
MSLLFWLFFFFFSKKGILKLNIYFQIKKNKNHTSAKFHTKKIMLVKKPIFKLLEKKIKKKI